MTFFSYNSSLPNYELVPTLQDIRILMSEILDQETTENTQFTTTKSNQQHSQLPQCIFLTRQQNNKSSY
ncbi:unnamed protein product [Paramecium octaurelia]|uniref:Uncharacterized protein n=1 Tax=Paramecium octaurelia TaxID=43137 RepID=A0A8S1W9W7_PAROT|nr:unnamed protein product [Paramecium octaurelia]